MEKNPHFLSFSKQLLVNNPSTTFEGMSKDLVEWHSSGFFYILFQNKSCGKTQELFLPFHNS